MLLKLNHTYQKYNIQHSKALKSMLIQKDFCTQKSNKPTAQKPHLQTLHLSLQKSKQDWKKTKKSNDPLSSDHILCSYEQTVAPLIPSHEY